jgi:hypothetical protein
VSERSDRALGLPSPKPYRPWNTLGPHAWLPIADLSDDELRLGATTGGADALGYHAWVSTVTWSVARRAELDPIAPGARPDYSFFYSYSRWRPTFYAEVSDDTTPLLLPETDSSPALPLSLRKRALESGIVVPFRRVRREQAIFSAYRFERARLEAADASDTVDRAALRGGWLLDTSKRYGYSISPESGVTIGLVGESARAALGGSGNATMVRMDVRGYVAVGPRHAVLAGRATASASRGDVDTRRLLRLGGPDGNPTVISFDEDASSLLRGFPANAFRGSTIGLINVEYRVPIAWIERGAGTWPVFLRSLHATVFADAGHAWTATPRLRDVKTSWGIEAASDVVAGFVLPLTLTAGIGWGHDGAGVLRDDRQLYVRLGYGF